MKKTRNEKGITLIALIITIVVLLILAVIAIRAVQGNGIIAHAQNAATAYEQAQTDEQIILDTYLAKLQDDDIYKVTIENVNLYNKDEMKIGYYVFNNSEGKNDSYMSTGYINVEPGDEIYWTAYLPEYERFDYELTNKYYSLQSVTYISTYDSNKEYKETITGAGITFDYDNNNENKPWTVPEGVSYIRLNLVTNYGRSELADTLFVCKNEPPKYYAEYGQTQAIVNYSLYLPEKIQISAGTNFNIYNTNICPKLYSEELTFKWQCKIGTSNSDGISFNPTSQDIGSYAANVFAYDKSNNLVNSATINIEVVTNTINESKNILLIGDSLSNGKSWITEVEELSGDKISLTASAVSGASSYRYYTSSTLSSTENNPFYNSELGTFDYEYYLQSNNVNYDSVMLFLGTNDMSFTQDSYPKIDSDRIKLKSIVDNIKEYDSDLPIYIITPMTTVNDYFRSKTAMNFVKDFYNTFNSYANVTIIPIELTVDQVNDFGSDRIHPLESGYKKIADAIYSSLCANQ